MEVTVVEAEVVLGLLGVEVEKSLAGGGGQVETSAVDVDGRRRGQHLEHPEGPGARGPGVAEDGLVVAVDQGRVRGVGQSSELARGLVEGSFDLEAMSYSSNPLSLAYRAA